MGQRSTLVAVLLSLYLCLGAVTARAQSSSTYEPDRDNTIYEENENSNGAGLTVTIGRTSGNMGTLSRRALVRFDVGGDLPKGATIESAMLTMGVQKGNPEPRDASLYVITEDWGEGTASSTGGQGAPATVGDATWTCRFSDGAAGCLAGDEWAAAGGSFVAMPSATASVGDTGTTVSWSSAQMAMDVQGWLESPESNYGWIVVGIEDITSTAKQLHSREAADVIDRPMLVVEYTCPDFDEDGFENVVCGGTDCNDEDGTINPDASEICDEVDNDCDPLTDETDVCNAPGTGGVGGLGGAAGVGGAAGAGGAAGVGGMGGAAGMGGSPSGSGGGGCSIAFESRAVVGWTFALYFIVFFSALRRALLRRRRPAPNRR